MEKNIISRIKDLDSVCFQRNITKHSCFLSASELSEYYSIEKELKHPYRVLFGGFDEAERKIIFWLNDNDNDALNDISDANDSKNGNGIGNGNSNKNGDSDDHDNEHGSKYDFFSPFISCIKASPVNEKYADALSHRDYLGALMNLGIERDQIGDIVIKDSSALIFCMSNLCEIICNELTKVKHTNIHAETVPLSSCDAEPKFADIKVNAASERLDAIISAVFHISRSKVTAAIETEKVFVDGKTVTSSGQKLKEGSRISVRGFGKFIYSGISHESKKGRLFVDIRMYV